MVRYVLPVKELDMRLHSTIVADRMNAVPGFRTSAAFFTFLRANLVLPPQHSTYNSPTSTPLLYASSSQTLLPLPRTGPSTLATSTSYEDFGIDYEPVYLPPPARSSPPEIFRFQVENLPIYTTTTVTSAEDKDHALQLIAESVSEQRQIALKAIILHPFIIATYTLFIYISSVSIYESPKDLVAVFTAMLGVTAACFAIVQSVSSRYMTLAKEIGPEFLQRTTSLDDILITTKLNTKVIGTAILRLEPKFPTHNPGSPHRRRSKNSFRKAGGKGLVRAWTVGSRYRGEGVGTGLLEEVVRITRERLGKDAEIGFAVEHANSKMVLWEWLNGSFRKGERRAARWLEKVGEEGKGKRKKAS